MLKNYILTAFRNLIRNKAISLINIIGLSISMSICLLLIIIITDQYSIDSFLSNKDRIYRVITERTLKDGSNLWSTASTSYALFDEIKGHTSIEMATAFSRKLNGVIKWEDKELPFGGYYTGNEFLDVFSFPMEMGNRESALSNPNSIILSHKLAQKLFGSSDGLNELVSIDGVGEFVVTGILAELPGKTHLEFEALVPASHFEARSKQDTTIYTGFHEWSDIYMNYIYFQAKDHADLSDLKSQLNDLSAEHYDDEEDYAYTFKIQAFNNISPGPILSNNPGFSFPTFLIYTMAAIALVVLLSACLNYANLTTARAMNRAKEIGVRKVVGAGRQNIFLQFIIESLAFVLIAFVFADLSVQFLLPKLNSYFQSVGAPFMFEEVPNLYAWFFLFIIITGLIAGIVPAVFFSATKPLQALSKSVRLEQIGRKLGFVRFSIRKVLVVAQFAFSIFFLITIITIYQQMNYVLNTDHGYRTDGLVQVELQGLEYEKVEPLFNSISGIQYVSSVSHMPSLGSNNTEYARVKEEDEPIAMSYIAVGPSFLPMMELQLVAGENFSGPASSDEKEIIINQTATEKFGWTKQEALGKTILLNESELVVVGVIKDFHYERMDKQIGPMALRNLPQRANEVLVHIQADTPKETVKQMEASWKTITTRPFEYSYYEDEKRMSYAHFEAGLVLLGYVTLVVISLACLGLLGMVIYHVQNKTKEIGIRKTLGAEGKDILWLTGKGFLVMVVVAYVVAAPISYFVNLSWLETNAYRIDFGLPTLLLGLVFILGIVALAVGTQLFKALKVNPSESLRSE